MTDVPVDDPEALRHLLANTQALLLDFDGPVCSVFAGFPASVVADQLRQTLAEGGHVDIPTEITASDDPFDVLKYAATLGTNETRYVEAAFRAHEVEAIPTAAPTQGAHDLICAWKSTGRPLAIVSNNSTAAVETYLDIYRLKGQIDHIAARTTSDVKLLKPCPHLVDQAVTALGIAANKTVLVGDSATDIEAARAAKVQAIGYANKPGKAEKLKNAGAVMVINSINAIKIT
jgi:phosphoglycolate phosphatase